ncbi:hypothetical protein [Corynebacterium sp.]|uniref:hypothetical protein n=1 Tax=Corynebacterium sp. TaxID=1720 RepID=UPI0026DB0C01|nr:hypothetical protein [Corynebacterium sp.]MDO5076495.1 hypothetical protein [Corynebacterium sp.]
MNDVHSFPVEWHTIFQNSLMPARLEDGDVLDSTVPHFTVHQGSAKACPGTDLQSRLPLAMDVSAASLNPDVLDQQLHAAEVKD